MRKLLFTGTFLLLLTALMATGFKSATSGLPYLFMKTDLQGTSKAVKDESLIKGINVIADLGALASDKQPRLKVPLPDGKEIVVRRQRADKSDRTLGWYGDVEGEKKSFVHFTSTGKALNGRIEIGSRHFRVIYLGKGVHQIGELDKGKMDELPDDGEVPKYGKPRDRKDMDGCPDPASDIDVMVVYTQDAEDGAGGATGMEALIYQSMHLTNLSYENSDINQRVRLVHHAKVDYAEAANSATDREALRHESDGNMDEIHGLRDVHGADIVMLITETAETNNCGRAYIMDPVSPDHEAFAFGVVKRECAADNLSFPHELGHIMGALHQDDGSTTPYPYAHGFFLTTPSDGSGIGWETIMSKRGDCDRQIMFSNPDIQFSPTGSLTTDAAGTAADQDNSRVLDNTAATVANFRCSSPNVGDVWMKDRWEDTGLEPDAATAGMAMYLSPYIWVRNAQDPTFLHQHEHNDPEFGSDNWIYVKMHNGSMSSQSGNLELYIADASVSLTWPTGWNLVATVPVTLAGSSTEVIEQLWNTVPDPTSGSTHYCMIARWVSAADPMAVAETSNIENNTRNNNNIVWRNLNVVDLDSDADSKVAMNINGVRGSKLARISFEDLTQFPKPKFTATGHVYVAVDSKLYNSWKNGGSKSLGMKEVDNGLFELSGNGGYLDNVYLPSDYRGLIKVMFKKSDQTPASKFHFSVKHYLMDSGTPKLLGGVDYELVKK